MNKRIYNIILINSAIVAVGVLLFVAGLIKGSSFLMPLGAGSVVSGIVKTMQMVKILKGGEAKIKEFESSYDERNTMIEAQAGSLSFKLFCLVSFVCSAILALIGMEDVALIIAYVACVLIFIYLVCYWYYSKKY